MVLKIQVVYIALLLFVGPWANGQDSLVLYKDVSFSNNVEQQYFRQALSGDPNAFFGAFISMNEKDTSVIARWEKHFSTYIEEVQNAKRPKKNEKFVKKVYNGLHDKFLKKYELQAYFDQIFKGGKYNCVTACAMYGLAFDRLGIPFSIKETPTHVYLIAFPGQEQILIETTDPISGFKTFSPGFKENFVVQLASLKLIDQAEMGKGVNSIFDKYYFTEKNLGLKELVGIHYYNSGIESFNGKNYLQAVSSFEKSYLLYNSRQVSDMLFNSIISVLAKTDYNSWEEISLLAKLPRFEEEYDIGKDEAAGEFSRLMQLHLTNKNDTAYVRKAYELISSNISNPEVQTEFDFLYNYERGRLLYNRGNYEKALVFAERAYAARPGHADAESLLISAYSRAFEISRDSKQALEKLEELLANYEFLKSNNHLGGVWLNLYLLRMGEEFDNKNISLALEYKTKFEQKSEEHNNFRYNEFEVGKAYSKGVVYYFKRGQYTSARKLLDQGLKFSPDNSELRARLYMLNRN